MQHIKKFSIGQIPTSQSDAAAKAMFPNPSQWCFSPAGLVKTKTSLITSVGGAKQWSNYIKYDSEWGYDGFM